MNTGEGERKKKTLVTTEGRFIHIARHPRPAKKINNSTGPRLGQGEKEKGKGG